MSLVLTRLKNDTLVNTVAVIQLAILLSDSYLINISYFFNEYQGSISDTISYSTFRFVFN